MLSIAPLGPENELPVAQRLHDLVATAWPDIVGSGEDDRVRIFVGLRMQMEVDLLVEIALSHPRSIPSRRRRDGTMSHAASVSTALIAIEVKQLDASRFETRGMQIFARYGSEHERRSVNQQVADSVRAVRRFAERYGATPFVHGIGWLTEVPGSRLTDVEPIIIGREANWFDLLDAAAQQNTNLYREQLPEYRQTIATVCNVLARRRTVKPLDRERVDRLTTSAVTRDVLEQARPLLGDSQIRLAGGAGAGKSTTLALLASGIARIKQERVLLLTYNVALREQLERLVRGMIGNDAIFERNVRVDMLQEFLVRACEELGAEIPRKPDGSVDYARFEPALAAFLSDAEMQKRRAADAAVLKELDPARFAFDYVFIDECQDCTDAERDGLRLFFPRTRFVLADGLDQLVRRGTPCDWQSGLPGDSHAVIELRRSLRVAPNIAAFVTAFAHSAGLGAWHVESHPELAGGRIVLMQGAIGASFVQSVEEFRAAARASPVDVLVCVPSGFERDRRHWRAHEIESLFQSAGKPVWQGYDAIVRRSESPQTDQVRLIFYDSSRGLEGWVTVLTALDEFYDQRVRYPNLPVDERRPAAEVAREWLLMALMRASHTLVVHADSEQSLVARWLQEAAESLPPGVVEKLTL
ncbi:MAG: hypothetical protein ABSE64_15990 [Vulcanimicrobiaceae bacterium]|jgi:hypothetical protein